jgi:hypothetical protein
LYDYIRERRGEACGPERGVFSDGTRVDGWMDGWMDGWEGVGVVLFPVNEFLSKGDFDII